MATTSAPRKSTGSDGSGKRRSIPILGIIFGVIVVILIAVVLFGNSEPGSEYGDPQVEGLLPPMPGTAPADTTATGMAVPSVVGQDFDGSEVVISDDGTAKAIVFLAHWCPHCQNEVPRVQAWLDETGGVEGVDLYSVSTSMSSARENYPASDWLAREGWTSPVIRDDKDSTVVSSFGGGGYPYWVFTNADGTVALRTSGELAIADLEQIMNSLEKG
jgi:thiol-disulfide isomerase/thioredoxin